METTARSKVIVDGQQAEQALSELTQEAKKYRQAMADAIKANDLTAHKKAEQQWKSTNKAIKDARVELYSVDKVMKDLSGSSMKQLQFAKRALTSELNKMSRGTEEYVRKSKQLQMVNQEIKKVRGEMYGASNTSTNMFSKLRTGFMWLAGALASSMALWRGFTSTMKSTQTGADSLERKMKGLKGAITGLQQSIAQGDWKNLVQNMKSGYLAAASYADALDELADRMRAVDVRTSEQRAEMEELRNIMASTETTSIEEREQAQNRYMELNKEILEATRRNANLQIKSERDRLKEQHNITDEQVDLMIDYVRNYDKLSDNELAAVKKILDAEKDLSTLRQAFIDSHTRYVKVGDSMVKVKGAEADLTDEQRNRLVQLNEQHQKEKGLLSEKAKSYLSLTKAIDNFSDDYRDNVAKALKSVASAESQFENLQRNAIRRREALEREKLEREKENQKAELESLEQQHQILLLEIEKNYTENHQSATLYRQQTEAAEWAHLEARLALYRHFGMNSVDLERQRQAKIIQAMEAFRQEQDLISNELINKNIADTDAAILAEFEADAIEIEAKKKANQEKARLDQQAYDAYVQKMEQYKTVASGMASSLGDLLGRAATDAEMTAQEVAKQILLIALDGLHGIVQVTMGEIWTKAIGLGPLAIAGAIAKIAAIEAIFAGVKAAVSQRAEGKYDVIGADDGRNYNQVPYSGVTKTGVYSLPTLVAERGDELIVDHGTLNNVRVNFPDVLPKIQASMVPQRASGNVEKFVNDNSVSHYEADMINAIEKFNESVNLFNRQVAKGINAKVSYSHFKTQDEKATKILNDSSRKG